MHTKSYLLDIRGGLLDNAESKKLSVDIRKKAITGDKPGGLLQYCSGRRKTGEVKNSENVLVASGRRRVEASVKTATAAVKLI